MRAFSTIRVPEPRLELSAPGFYRVAATVEGEEVFFESSLPLSAGAESFACAFLLPAMARGARLEVESPLGASNSCRTWTSCAAARASGGPRSPRETSPHPFATTNRSPPMPVSSTREAPTPRTRCSSSTRD